MVSRFARSAVAAALAMASFSIAIRAEETAPDANGLTSPAIDPSIYREGAIRRFSGQQGQWTYVCDEVVKIGRRFCSLRTLVMRSDGQPLASVTVSTGQDGRPAALLRMAASDVPRTGLEVTPISAADVPGGKESTVKKAAASPGPSKYFVFAADCSGGICQLIWTLPVEHIAALNGTSGLKVRSQTFEFLIPADGFAAAVDASTAQSK